MAADGLSATFRLRPEARFHNGDPVLAADVKRIGWSDVMDSFRMHYDSATMGGSVDFALPQKWKDQTVTNLGLAWAATPSISGERMVP